MRGEILDFLKMHDVEYKENLLLASISPIRIGGEADIVTYPKDISQLVLLLDFLRKNKIKHKIVGRMSNILPPDDKFNGILIRTDKINNIDIQGREVIADCGCSLIGLSSTLSNAGLSGLEELSGIPGSVGGSLVGNAGAFGREISDSLLELLVYDTKNGDVRHISPIELGFAYRTSKISELGYIVLSVKFRFIEDSPDLIKHRVYEFKQKRLNTQPVGYPSLGSTFKRPSDGVFAARLIDECRLKGVRVGGAQISEKHAGFVINIGGATAKDYIDLSDYTADVVYDRFNIRLQREVEIMEGGE